jgi:hypothetical protein
MSFANEQFLKLVQPTEPLRLVNPLLIHTLKQMVENSLSIDKLFIKYMKTEVIIYGSHFLKQELKILREELKQFEKLQEKYDSALSKYITKAKDNNTLLEDGNALFQLRKAYLKDALKLSLSLGSFHFASQQFLSKLLTLYCVYQSDFHYELSSLLQGIRPFLEEWQNQQLESEQHLNEYKGQLETLKQSLEADIQLQDPNRKLPLTPTTTKQGYLFKKLSPKIGPVVWNKRFFVLDKGRLSFQFLLSPGTKEETLVTSSTLNVLLCSVRLIKNEDRRNTFEIINPKRYYYVFMFLLKNTLVDKIKY